jgi:hypothetical protein
MVVRCLHESEEVYTHLSSFNNYKVITNLYPLILGRAIL